MTYTGTCVSSCTASANGADGKTVTTCCDSNNCNTATPTAPSLTSCYLATSGSTSWPSSVSNCDNNSAYKFCKVI